MAKNLFDFGDENLKPEELNNNYNQNYSQKNATNNSNNNNTQNTGEQSNNIKQQAETLYKKYKDYSQDNLIQEFLTSSKQKLKDGSLTQDKINSTANALLPFLNDSQKQMMKNLLEQLND